MTTILHVSLEYQKSGLLKSLNHNKLQVAIVTPHYTFINQEAENIEELTTIEHTYMGATYKSQLSRMVAKYSEDVVVYHYLIKPASGSPVLPIFNIDNENSIYQTSAYSSLQQRIEYFNSAVAAMVREVNDIIPIFDIVDLHSWHTGLAACLIKEFSNVHPLSDLNKTPYIVSTIRINEESKDDQITNVMELLQSLGLPVDLAENFPHFEEYINSKYLKQLALSLLYADGATIESKILIKNIINGTACGLEKIFIKLYDEGRLFHIAQEHDIQQYIEIYKKIISQILLTTNNIRLTISKPIIRQFSSYKTNNKTNLEHEPVRVLHVALEYGDATLGGLGSVTTQMVDAQNRFVSNELNHFASSIITPFYPEMYKNYKNIELVFVLEHLYNNELIKSNVYLAKQGLNNHYMISPLDKHKLLFHLPSSNHIYNDNQESYFIDRVKFFNSAVASYVHKTGNGIQHPDPNILLLHDWQAALTPQILSEVYKNNKIKSVFIVHVANVDYGGYQSEQLQGIGINFKPGLHMLKGIGLKEANKIVAVSPSFLQECKTVKSSDINIDTLRRIFVLSAINDNKVIGILNGFNYNKFCPLGTLMDNDQNIVECKTTIKKELSSKLHGFSSIWHINSDLPVIFYIGRFSPEKGVETFAQVIKLIKNRAIFFALGRGVTDSVYQIIQEHSKKTDNVFVSFNEEDQKKYGAMMRACADFTFVPSHREACGLVPMEGFANGSLCITSGVGGLKDSVSQLKYDDKSEITGNGFIYEDKADGEQNHSLLQTIDQALTLWGELTIQEKNTIHTRLMHEAKNFDWLATNGALSKYLNVVQQLLEEPISEQVLNSKMTYRLGA